MKRKRDKDGSKKSSKKVGIEGTSTVKVSLVEDRDDWAPLVGMFASPHAWFATCL